MYLRHVVNGDTKSVFASQLGGRDCWAERVRPWIAHGEIFGLICVYLLVCSCCSSLCKSPEVVNRVCMRQQEKSGRWGKTGRSAKNRKRIVWFQSQCVAAGSLEVPSTPTQHGYLMTWDPDKALRFFLLPSSPPNILLVLHPLHWEGERKLPFFAQSQGIWQELGSIKENIRGESQTARQNQDGRISCIKHFRFIVLWIKNWALLVPYLIN